MSGDDFLFSGLTTKNTEAASISIPKIALKTVLGIIDVVIAPSIDPGNVAAAKIKPDL